VNIDSVEDSHSLTVCVSILKESCEEYNNIFSAFMGNKKVMYAEIMKVIFLLNMVNLLVL